MPHGELGEYQIGRFTLQPHRQLLDRGKPVAIGRKALDLLSILATAEGELLTKEELMAAAWPQSIVEDNALQVHIAALRKLLGTDAVNLTTVRGLGYRLAGTPANAAGAAPPAGLPPPTGPAQAAAGAGPLRRSLSAVVPAVLAAVASIWPLSHWSSWVAPSGHAAKVAILRFNPQDSRPGTQSLAAEIGDRMAQMLSEGQVQVVTQHPDSADLVIGGTVRSDGKTFDVHTELDDAREHVILWSDSFHADAASTKTLAAESVAHMAEVVLWAAPALTGRVRLHGNTLRNFIDGQESMAGVRHADSAAARTDYEKVVAAEPDFAWGHAAVACAAAFELDTLPPSDTTAQLAATARHEAEQALAIDPRTGAAYFALQLLLPRHMWQGREQLLLKANAADPSFEPEASTEGRLLWLAGRGHDARGWFERSRAVNPVYRGGIFLLALNLAAEGFDVPSRDLLHELELSWPGDGATKSLRFWTDIISGRLADAAADIADPDRRPDEIDEQAAEAWRMVFAAGASKSPAAMAGAAARVQQAASVGSLPPGDAVVALTMLGEIDAAFAQAERYEPTASMGIPYLFLPPLAPLRHDPRFIAVARHLGMVEYWQATGNWPDYCAEPGLPYDCRAEAAKALPAVGLAGTRHGAGREAGSRQSDYGEVSVKR